VESAPPTEFVRSAAAAFAAAGKRTILDVGCGAGRDAFYLADQRFDVTGVDLAESGLRIACRMAAMKPTALRFVMADARDLPLPADSFDAVYCFGLLHEFTDSAADRDVEMVIAEIRRVLRPLGQLALAVLASDPAEGLPHVRLFTEKMFDDATRSLHMLHKRLCYDVGCTGRANYLVWSGIFHN
jgi:ubiquinone/menaquinone biosynthesis C-methylase UbiE